MLVEERIGLACIVYTRYMVLQRTIRILGMSLAYLIARHIHGLHMPGTQLRTSLVLTGTSYKIPTTVNDLLKL